MKFYRNIIKSFSEVENCCSMIVHSLVGCNMHCFKCHNYKELIEGTHDTYYNEGELLEVIQRDGEIFDCIIFSGGEFLLDSLDNLITFLKKVREIYKGKVIINTNGSNAMYIDVLYNAGLIDGVHVDMKLPYHLMDIEEDSDIFEQVLGIKATESLISNCLKSVDLALLYGKYSKVRTVRYPILDNSFFDEIEKYVATRKKELHSDTDYEINSFVDIE